MKNTNWVILCVGIVLLFGQALAATEVHLNEENEPPIVIWWHGLKDRVGALYYRATGRAEEAARTATTVSAREAAEKWKQASREADKFAHLVEKEEVGESMWNRLPESIRLAYDKVVGTEEVPHAPSAWQRAKDTAGSFVEKTKEGAEEALEKIKHPFVKEEPVPEGYIAHIYHKIAGKPEYVEEPASYAEQAREKLTRLYHKVIGAPLPEPEEEKGVFASAKDKISSFFGRATAEYEPESTVAATAHKASELAGKATAAVGAVAEKGKEKVSELIDSTMDQIESVFAQARNAISKLHSKAVPMAADTEQAAKLRAEAEKIWEEAKKKASELYHRASLQFEPPQRIVPETAAVPSSRVSWPWAAKETIPSTAKYDFLSKPEFTPSTRLTQAQIQAVADKVFDEARQKILTLTSAGPAFDISRYTLQKRSIWDAAKAKVAEIYYRATAEAGDEYSLKRAEQAAQWAELARQRAEEAAQAALRSEQSYRSAVGA